MYVKKSYFVIHQNKKKTLVLEPKPKIVGSDKGEEDMVTIKVVSYNYDECRKALEKIIILDELPFNFVNNHGFKSFYQ